MANRSGTEKNYRLRKVARAIRDICVFATLHELSHIIGFTIFGRFIRINIRLNTISVTGSYSDPNNWIGVLLTALIIPVVLQLIYARWRNISLKYMIPFLLYTHRYDMGF